MMAAPSAIEPAPRPRWWDFVRHGRLFCPAHHHIPNTLDVTEAGYIRCHHWIAAERRECGLWIFLYAIRGGGLVVASLSLDEKRAMAHLTTPAEIIEYLGIFRR